MITKLPGPESPGRIESGPIQFGDDWPGIFLRGDNAMYYALTLQHALEAMDDSKLMPLTRVTITISSQTLNPASYEHTSTDKERNEDSGEHWVQL